MYGGKEYLKTQDDLKKIYSSQSADQIEQELNKLEKDKLAEYNAK